MLVNKSLKSKPCLFCGKIFTPKHHNRTKFCTRTCGATWKWQQPEIRNRLMNWDRSEVGKAISLGIMANPKDRIRRRKQILKAMAEGKKGPGGNPRITKEESIVRILFPKALRNFPIATGQSSKLGNPQMYWMDFAWPPIKLNVEVDGYYHRYRDHPQKDAARDLFLSNQGWRVLRFTNAQVRQNPTKVKHSIEHAISQLQKFRDQKKHRELSYT